MYPQALREIAIGGHRVESSKDKWDRMMGVGNNTQGAMCDSNFPWSLVKACQTMEEGARQKDIIKTRTVLSCRARDFWLNLHTTYT